MTQRSFTDVIVDRQPTILRVTTECLPLIAGVPDGLAQGTLGQHPLSNSARRALIRSSTGSAWPHGSSRRDVGRQLAGLLLDVVQLSDPLQDLVHIPR